MVYSAQQFQALIHNIYMRHPSMSKITLFFLTFQLYYYPNQKPGYFDSSSSQYDIKSPNFCQFYLWPAPPKGWSHLLFPILWPEPSIRWRHSIQKFQRFAPALTLRTQFPYPGEQAFPTNYLSHVLFNYNVFFHSVL